VFHYHLNSRQKRTARAPSIDWVSFSSEDSLVTTFVVQLCRCFWGPIIWRWAHLVIILLVDLWNRPQKTRKNKVTKITMMILKALINTNIFKEKNKYCTLRLCNQNWGGFHKAIYALRLKFVLCTHLFWINLL
jgi:hypothetical protein